MNEALCIPEPIDWMKLPHFNTKFDSNYAYDANIHHSVFKNRFAHTFTLNYKPKSKRSRKSCTILVTPSI